ncbi:MAG: hypothetical protein ACW97A_06345, partial [Candidatus Thorarchaeota archaeon]
MARSYSRLLTLGFVMFFVALMLSSGTPAQAQMVEDDSLGVLLEFGGRNIINAPEDDPIRILRNQ